MRNNVGRWLVLASSGLAAAFPANAALAQAEASLEITEWTVPWETTRPRDPYVAPSGAIWFVGQGGDYAAALDSESGEFSRFDLDPGTGPHNLIVGEDGIVWYAGNRAQHIGRLDPETGTITKYPMPKGRAHDPHTLVRDGDGHIWFTSQRANEVGCFNSESGEVRLLEVPTPNARPYGIIVASDGRIWFTEFGTNKLGVIDPERFEVEEVELPREKTRPRRLGETSDGHIWYVDYAAGYLGRVDPTSGEVSEWPTPGGRGARPYGMAVDGADRVWFVETGSDPNRFVGFDTASESYLANREIKSRAGTVRHMFYDGASGSVWFGTDVGTIGRAKVDRVD